MYIEESVNYAVYKSSQTLQLQTLPEFDYYFCNINLLIQSIVSATNRDSSPLLVTASISTSTTLNSSPALGGKR